MIEMHIHISLDKDTDAVAEGAKLKELLNTALVGDFTHTTCKCKIDLPAAEDDTDQVTVNEVIDAAEAEAEVAKEVAKEVASEEPKKEEKKKKAKEPKKEEKKKKADAPKIKIEDVRAVLSEYKSKGGDLKAVLAPYGANLPSVKESDYAALLRDAEEALSKIEEAE